MNVLAAAIRPEAVTRGAMPRREAALQTAARLQEASAEALYVEAMIAFGERRWKDSERFLARATEAQPGPRPGALLDRDSPRIHGRTDQAARAISNRLGRSIRSRPIRMR